MSYQQVAEARVAAARVEARQTKLARHMAEWAAADGVTSVEWRKTSKQQGSAGWQTVLWVAKKEAEWKLKQATAVPTEAERAEALELEAERATVLQKSLSERGGHGYVGLEENVRVQVAMARADRAAEKARVSGTKEESDQAAWAARWSAAIERAKIRLEKARAAAEGTNEEKDRTAFIHAYTELLEAKTELRGLEKKVAEGIKGMLRGSIVTKAQVESIDRGWVFRAFFKQQEALKMLEAIKEKEPTSARCQWAKDVAHSAKQELDHQVRMRDGYKWLAVAAEAAEAGWS
jgi:hypothetical protein